MCIGVWVGGSCVFRTQGSNAWRVVICLKYSISVSCACCFHVLFSSTNGACKNEIKWLVTFTETDCASFL